LHKKKNNNKNLKNANIRALKFTLLSMYQKDKISLKNRLFLLFKTTLVLELTNQKNFFKEKTATA